MPIGDDFPQVLDAARLGADWAWAALYRDLVPSARGYLAARGAPDPDDVVGETFLQMVRDLPTFEGGERELRAWVFTIVHHRLLDARRREARRPLQPASDEALVRAGVRAGEVGDVEDEAMAGLTVARLRQLVGRLSADQQDVLLLRLFGDLAIADVAAIVGKRPGAVKALLRRGLASLRKEISREGVPI
ncbi:MAG: RNA polymerase sigma factor [Actinomycetota bacterium]